MHRADVNPESEQIRVFAFAIQEKKGVGTGVDLPDRVLPQNRSFSRGLNVLFTPRMTGSSCHRLSMLQARQLF